MTNTKKKLLKSTEELIIEEMAKYKFKAKTLNKQMFNIDAISPIKEKKVVNIIEDKEKRMISPILEELIETSPILNEKSNYLKSSLSRGRMTITSLYSDKRISKEKNIIKKESKKRNNSFSSENEEKYVFRAREIPEFRVKQIKLSTKYLTIPNPPKLSCLKKVK